MKKLLSSSLLCLVLLCGTGCKKLLVYAEEHGEPYIVANKKIASIVTSDSSWFIYNAAGDPAFCIHPQPATGYPDFLLRYDSLGHLTDLIGAYDTTLEEYNVEVWNKYYYNGAGDIVLDTLIVFPTVVNGQPTIGEHGNLIVATYSYDASHRMTQYTNLFVGYPPATVVNYSYDSAGNLVGVGHDTEINFYRTNKWWQFLNQDYSVNNPTSATYTYNSDGLPVTINASAAEFFVRNPFDYFLHFTTAKIYYML